jgi:hypothetical protein
LSFAVGDMLVRAKPVKRVFESRLDQQCDDGRIMPKDFSSCICYVPFHHSREDRIEFQPSEKELKQQNSIR